MPLVSFARRTARSRSAADCTVPVSVTTEPFVSTLIVRALDVVVQNHLRLDLCGEGTFGDGVFDLGCDVPGFLDGLRRHLGTLSARGAVDPRRTIRQVQRPSVAQPIVVDKECRDGDNAKHEDGADQAHDSYLS